MEGNRRTVAGKDTPSRRNEASDLTCTNAQCDKWHCWRHPSNRRTAGDTDLNPTGRTLCPYYLGAWRRRELERRGKKSVAIKQIKKEGGLIWEGTCRTAKDADGEDVV